MSKKKTNQFLVHGGILALASFLVRLIGMIYRIPMVNIIGSEGNGYYSNAFSVYNILLLLSSYSLPLAVSKMVSARVAVGKWKEVKQTMTAAVIFGVVIGLAFGLLTYFGADFFCTKILKSPLSAIALRMMAPTVFIMALLGVLRGFFQGLETTIPTAISQILEQIVNAVISVLMASILVKKGAALMTGSDSGSMEAAWGAAGGTIGTGAGAFIALMFLAVVFYFFMETFRRNVKRDRHKQVAAMSELTKVLLLTALPVIYSSAAFNCIDFVDAAFFNHYMSAKGMETAAYTKIWGDYNSAFITLIHLPVSLATAIGSALVPALSAAFAKEDRRGCLARISLTVKVTLLISIPAALGMMAIGGNLAKLLFPRIEDEAMKFLVVGGIAVVFYSMSTVTNAILHGLNKMNAPVIHALIALFAHVGVLALLLFVFDLEIYAVIGSYIAFSLVMTVLNFIRIYRLTGYLPDFLKTVGIPCIVSLVMVLYLFLVAFLVSRFLTGNTANLVIVAVGFIGGILIYAAGVLKLGVLSKKQLQELPGGSRILGLAMKLKLMR